MTDLYVHNKARTKQETENHMYKNLKKRISKLVRKIYVQNSSPYVCLSSLWNSKKQWWFLDRLRLFIQSPNPSYCCNQLIRFIYTGYWYLYIHKIYNEISTKVSSICWFFKRKIADFLSQRSKALITILQYQHKLQNVIS